MTRLQDGIKHGERVALISEKVAGDLRRASWIREMFEQGLRLKQELGADRVFDFSLGNPSAAPPREFFDAVRDLALHPDPTAHRYMPNAGFPEARAAVAEFVTKLYDQPFAPDRIILTGGCAAAMNVVFRTVLNPGDEAIMLAPFFPEYRFYIEHAQGVPVVVPTRRDLQPDIDAVAAALTPRTRAVIVNSPNNPSGAVYGEEVCRGLAELLVRHDRPDRPIYVLCDDVYRRITFDAGPPPTMVGRYPRSIVCSSFSKDLSIAGERIGYIALPGELEEGGKLASAMIMLNRTLGFVNAGAFMQRVVTRCISARCDISQYQRNRDRLCAALREYGYELTPPGGGLFLFPRTPTDDAEFVRRLLEHRILVVPGQGFGSPGHIRISFCVEPAVIEGALPGFRQAIREVRP